jgi:hypothetical protein
MSGSAGAAWQPLRGIDPVRLSEARLQAHYALQWLARAARAYIAPQPDDAHTNLGWVHALDGFATHALPDGARLCLKIPSLTLALFDGERSAEFPLDGHADSEARLWLRETLGARGLPANALDAPSPYEMPAHALAEGARYDAARLPGALDELAAWFANAELLLSPLPQRMLERRFEASDLRCWPHHFDLATLISFPARNGETGYVGAGLSPGDIYYDEPYFYVSAYPRPDPALLPALPGLGDWHVQDFTAAIVPAHRILALQNRRAETEAFLDAAVDAAVKILR